MKKILSFVVIFSLVFVGGLGICVCAQAAEATVTTLQTDHAMPCHRRAESTAPISQACCGHCTHMGASDLVFDRAIESMNLSRLTVLSLISPTRMFFNQYAFFKRPVVDAFPPGNKRPLYLLKASFLI